ncbi:MAG: prolipoprotein diacylglyceryl transferase [Oscillospiraceae bacterium]|jgi:phosphatidylglycerol:prolipoprotein diacylglycerol transferase|nr:prolipoprotein diacylglyceryl transferase [Oscillospiraceae bacterium]MCI8716523.1 prolipoprotein diacylglyceryl transferase [Oscillospiraceae bacterium]
MYARNDMPISFPGLFGDWEVNPSPVALDIGNGIYWYGIIICAGLLLALLFCARQAKRYGLTEDNVYDMIVWQIPICIIGARLYYVIFYLDLYRNTDGSLNWGKMAAIWDGGLAIYGAVITAYVVLHIFCKKKNLSFGAFADLGVMGLLIGQAVGRWGNFMNREAFGGETTAPWRMRLWTSASEYIEVHPTFLYESLWNLAGLALIYFVISRARTFDGENTCFYFIWYGIGRTWIEGLRTDSLYLFGWELFGQPIRVSQLLSVGLVIAGLAVLVVNKRRHPRGRDALFVTKKEAALEAERASGEQEDAAL